MRFFSEPIDLRIEHPSDRVLRQLSAFTHQNNGEGAAKVEIPRFHGVFKENEFCIIRNSMTRNIFSPWMDARVDPDGESACHIRGSLHLDGIVLSLLLIFETLCIIMLAVNLVRMFAGSVTNATTLLLWGVPAAVALLLGGANYLRGARKLKRAVLEVLDYIKE